MQPLNGRLDVATHTAILEEQVLPDSGLTGATSLDSPLAIVLAGQPGAGKGAIVGAAKSEMRNLDELCEYLQANVRGSQRPLSMTAAYREGGSCRYIDGIDRTLPPRLPHWFCKHPLHEKDTHHVASAATCSSEVARNAQGLPGAYRAIAGGPQHRG